VRSNTGDKVPKRDLLLSLERQDRGDSERNASVRVDAEKLRPATMGVSRRKMKELFPEHVTRAPCYNEVLYDFKRLMVSLYRLKTAESLVVSLSGKDVSYHYRKPSGILLHKIRKHLSDQFFISDMQKSNDR
jgi:hypothetical protein